MLVQSLNIIISANCRSASKEYYLSILEIFNQTIDQIARLIIKNTNQLEKSITNQTMNKYQSIIISYKHGFPYPRKKNYFIIK